MMSFLSPIIGRIQSNIPQPLQPLLSKLSSLSSSQLVFLSLLALPALLILKRTLLPSASESQGTELDEEDDLVEESTTGTGTGKKTSVMSTENPDLLPPSDRPFTLEELKPFDGSDPSKPIYVSIKGTVFDVTSKREMYGPGKSYSVFAGKDGSRGLGMSSLKEADAVPDYSTLPNNERKVLDDWHAFFSKRYNIVGRVVDMPAPVANL